MKAYTLGLRPCEVLGGWGLVLPLGLGQSLCHFPEEMGEAQHGGSGVLSRPVLESRVNQPPPTPSPISPLALGDQGPEQAGGNGSWYTGMDSSPASASDELCDLEQVTGC